MTGPSPKVVKLRNGFTSWRTELFHDSDPLALHASSTVLLFTMLMGSRESAGAP